MQLLRDIIFYSDKGFKVRLNVPETIDLLIIFIVVLFRHINYPVDKKITHPG